ncbi:hypothetical protein LguiB_028930 [Lonicera macranthoides]
MNTWDFFITSMASNILKEMSNAFPSLYNCLPILLSKLKPNNKCSVDNKKSPYSSFHSMARCNNAANSLPITEPFSSPIFFGGH